MAPRQPGQMSMFDAKSVQHLSRIAFWAATVFAFVMAILPHPLDLPGSPSDKVQHIIAFTVITALCLTAYASQPWWKILLWLSAFGALIEVAQAIPMLHRDSDLRDWLADTAAVAIILLLSRLWRARREIMERNP